MCGIAGLIHRDGTGNIGQEMTAMLQSLEASRARIRPAMRIYGSPGRNEYVMRFKVAEQEDMAKGFDIHDEVKRRRAKVEERLTSLGVQIIDQRRRHRIRLSLSHPLRRRHEEARRLCRGRRGHRDPLDGQCARAHQGSGRRRRVADQYDLRKFKGTHGIGHTRMATESDVDIRSAHPYWAYPYNDIAVVHNGQLTNYWQMRREFERRGHRFMSNCDSRAARGLYRLQSRAWRDAGGLAAAVDPGASTASSPISSRPRMRSAWPRTRWPPSRWFSTRATTSWRSLPRKWRSAASFPHEIDTWDPYDEEVRVWRA